MEHREETTTLISAEKVSGTDVYNTAGDSLGEVHDVMIDKVSGRVTYAVMSFGGFLGIGQKYHPLPWSSLVYDTDKGGYVVSLSSEQLEGAPVFSDDVEPQWTREYEQDIHDHYGVRPYWDGLPPR
ncbi:MULTISPECIES: PRC-barrel domain-containing protein [Inquilinus]|uniref:Sporulation protein YlmC with PRC-barrel domain n=1 Tax=Inquilinus ginsengisoli TaxID=363840 RepID=A0ABU1JQ88_9PROT|nr:PRC-barrel domain-containing protein [Inquilinus ginsengisoli]MDR6290781.1 sporulation protein YlmC with PRC-barrel domain [Inquilinus ginsengisoli]